jgi:hypothetical protein
VHAIKELLPRLEDAARLFRSLRKALDEALASGKGALRTAVRKSDDAAGPVPAGVTRYASDDDAVRDLIDSGRWRDPGTRPDFIGEGDWGFHLYGDDSLSFLGGAHPTLGRPAPPGLKADPYFMAPLDDLAHVKSLDDAVLHTGAADSVKTAVNEGRGVVGVAVPLDEMSPRVPTFADAGTNSNFLPGSYTALKHDGVVDLTPTREFVIDGGIPIRPGSILFQIKPDGTKEILGVFT